MTSSCPGPACTTSWTAVELGCRYLARTDRAHAKAGNLNHALKYNEGDFVVTLDADHVPQPDLIDRLLGFFENSRVAIVQVNQDFYNLDSFQHATDWEDRAAWQQQELFFNVIQPGKDALGAAMYCGSPAMLRRTALEEIGTGCAAGLASGFILAPDSSSLDLSCARNLARPPFKSP